MHPRLHTGDQASLQLGAQGESLFPRERPLRTATHARSRPRILAHAHPRRCFPALSCSRFERWLSVFRLEMPPSQLLALSALFQCSRLRARFERSPAPEQKSRDPEVQAQILDAWRKYGGLQPKVWGADRLQAAAAAVKSAAESEECCVQGCSNRTTVGTGPMQTPICSACATKYGAKTQSLNEAYVPACCGAVPASSSAPASPAHQTTAEPAAAAGSSAAPSGRLVPSVSRVHVEILPPSEYAGMNSEQDFSIRLRDLQRVPGGLLSVGAHVGENPVRRATVVSAEGQQASGSALDLFGLKIASKSPVGTHTVPVLLHNDPVDIRLTAYEADEKTVKGGRKGASCANK